MKQSNKAFNDAIRRTANQGTIRCSIAPPYQVNEESRTINARLRAAAGRQDIPSPEPGEPQQTFPLSDAEMALADQVIQNVRGAN